MEANCNLSNGWRFLWKHFENVIDLPFPHVPFLIEFNIAVESSGRTSAHSNVLDALRAIERCTAPAAYQVACDTKAAAAAAANAATTGKENGNLTAPGTIHSSSGDVTNGVGPPPQPV
eukprot:7543698-Ditylum_brightwellii.AAC.1